MLKYVPNIIRYYSFTKESTVIHQKGYQEIKGWSNFASFEKNKRNADLENRISIREPRVNRAGSSQGPQEQGTEEQGIRLESVIVVTTPTRELAIQAI